MHSTNINAGLEVDPKRAILLLLSEFSRALERVKLLQDFCQCMQSICGRITNVSSANGMAFRSHSSGQLAYSLACGQVAIDHAHGRRITIT